MNILKKLLSSLPFVKSYFHGKAAILMLHRIAPIDSARLPENENLKIDPVLLDNFITQAKQEGYNFISLDDFFIKLTNSSFIDKRNLILTIDDGYRDNYTYGFPIFKKHQIPFCIYLCTSFLDTPNMWWFSLEDFLLQNTSIMINDKISDITTIETKRKVFLQIRSLILKQMNTQTTAQKILSTFNIPHNINSYKDLSLTVEQIKQMLDYGGFTLGCHTHSHFVFNNLGFEEIKKDIFKSLEIINQVFNITSEHFCFPFGGNDQINQVYCDFIKQFPFKTAVTTRNGTIYPSHSNFTHVLPRISIYGKINFKNLIQFRKRRFVTYI